MPSPENIAFFQANQGAIAALVEKENARRSRRGISILTEAEIDAGVEEMLQISLKGKPWSSYRFPLPSSVPVVSQKAHISASQSEKLQFEISKCENGFVMSALGTQYIFKTPKELMGIFVKVLFGKDNDAS